MDTSEFRKEIMNASPFAMSPSSLAFLPHFLARRFSRPGIACATFARLASALVLGVFASLLFAFPLAAAPARSELVPLDQIGTVAGKQYQGDGLSVAATPDGARLKCVFQKLEGPGHAGGIVVGVHRGGRGEFPGSGHGCGAGGKLRWERHVCSGSAARGASSVRSGMCGPGGLAVRDAAPDGA